MKQRVKIISGIVVCLAMGTVAVHAKTENEDTGSRQRCARGSSSCQNKTERSKTTSTKQHTSTKKLHLKIGAQKTIELSENPTTGYSWSLGEWDNAIVTLIDSQYKKENNDILKMGGGGKRILTFQGVAAGTVEIPLKYMRSRETNVAPAEEITLKIVVNK